MFIEGRTFSMSETAIQQIEYFDDCQGTDSFSTYGCILRVEPSVEQILKP